MATLRNAILAARDAMTSVTAVTDLVPAAQITFGNSPQKQVNPRIVIEVSSAEYSATYLASRKVQTYTVEYAVYSDTVDQCTAIMDEVRLALDAYVSSDYSVRVTDESLQAEVDNVLLGVVVATFQDAAGVPGYDATVGQQLSAAQAALAAETAAWEAATGGTYEEYLNPPAFTDPGQLGGDATAIWALRRINPAYTGPLIQVADANSVNATNDGWDTVVNLNEGDYPGYHILTLTDENATSLDGIEWIITRIYDQVGTNDLVWDAQAAKDDSGSWPTFGPRLAFSQGAWGASAARQTRGFVSEEAVRYDQFTAAIDAHSGFAQPGARHSTFGAANFSEDNGAGGPYSAFDIIVWNTAALDYLGAVGAGPSAPFNYTLINPDAGTASVGGRRAAALTRKPLQATFFDGSSSITQAIPASNDPAPGSTIKVGWATDSYNQFGSSDDLVYGVIFYNGVHKTETELEDILNEFSLNQVGFRTLKQATTS